MLADWWKDGYVFSESTYKIRTYSVARVNKVLEWGRGSARVGRAPTKWTDDASDLYRCLGGIWWRPVQDWTSYD